MKTTSNPILAAGCAVMLAAAFHQAHAVDVIFKNAPGTVSLTNNLNWDGDALPGSGEMATWGAAVGGNSLGGSLTWASNTTPSYQGIKVVDALSNIAITSAGGATTLTLGSGGIDMSSAAKDLSIHDSTGASTTLGIIIGANQAWNVGTSRTLAVGNSDTTLTLNNNLTKTGAGAFTLGGSGATTLTGSGVLEINGGTFTNNMQTGSSSAGRSGATTLTSGNLVISTSISMFGSGAINLNGGAIGSGTGTTRTITNSINIGGNVAFGGVGFDNGGQLDFQGTTDLQGATRTLSSSITNTQGAKISGIISNGGITVANAATGVLTLSGANSFTGPTTVNFGYLAIGLDALANSSSVALSGANTRLFVGVTGTTNIKNLSGVSTATIRSDFTISGVNGTRALAVNQTSDGTFAGSFAEGVSRPISLTKTGIAILTLSGTGGYTAGTTIDGGRLNMDDARATGSNGSTSRNMTIKSGQLNLGWNSSTGAYGSATTNFAVLFTNLVMGGTGGGTSLLSSTGVISSNPVGFGVGPGTGGALSYDATNNGGTATLSAYWAASGTSGTGTATVTVGDSSATAVELDFTGRISNTGQNDGRSITLDKAGPGTMRISAANNYPRVQVSAGTLIVNHATALGASRTGDTGLSNLVTVNGGTLDLNGFSNSVGNLGGSGGVITNGAAGTSTLSAGSVGGSTSYAGTIQNGAGTVALTKQGSGTLTLTGPTTFTGTITAVGGTVSFADLPNGGAIAYNGGVVEVAGAAADTSNRGIQIGTVGGAITAVLNSSGAGALDMTSTAAVTNGGTLIAGAGLRLGGTNTGDNTFRGLLPDLSSVAIKLTKQDAGRWLVTNDNSFTGEVTINAGTLSVAKVAAMGTAQPLGQGTSPVAISNGARLEYTGVPLSTNRGLLLSGALGGVVDVASGSTLGLSGSITGSISQFRKGGLGTFNFSGSGSWGNDFYVDAGVMNISGTVANGGTLAAITVQPVLPATTATLRITGGGDVQGTVVDIQSGGTVRLEGGVLRTPLVSQASPGGFFWSGGTLTTRVTNPSVASGDGADVSGPGGPEVYTGRLGASDKTLMVTGDLTVSGNTTLDLGDLYESAGVIYNSIHISGALNVASGTLTLDSLNTAYRLRPSTGGTPFDYGTLVLLEAAGISGITPDGLGFTGLNFVAPGSDAGREFNQYTGGVWPLSGDPGALPVNTWHLQVTSNQILFHYHVSAAIPEPASAGLMVAGLVLLRAFKRKTAR